MTNRKGRKANKAKSGVSTSKDDKSKESVESKPTIEPETVPMETSEAVADSWETSEPPADWVSSKPADGDVDSKELQTENTGRTAFKKTGQNKRKVKADSSTSKTSVGRDQSTTSSAISEAAPALDFKQFLDKHNSSKHTDDVFTHVEEIAGDLFAQDSSYALAHCVAADFNMGSGIAVQFRTTFKQVPELLDQRQKQGGCAYLQHTDGRYVYYLVTKRESNGKPTLESFFKSVYKWRTLMLEHGVTKVAVPRLGCGLDRLEWNDVKNILEYAFKDTNVFVTVCNFQEADMVMEEKKQKHVQRKCFVTTSDKHITAIEKYTIIIVLGTEDGFVSDDMKALDKTFGNVISEYRRATKAMGSAIKMEKRRGEYMIYCCIVSKNIKDHINYVALNTCITTINKENKKIKPEPYSYLAMQSFKPKNDDLAMSKITNLLRNTLYNVDIYICTGRAQK